MLESDLVGILNLLELMMRLGLVLGPIFMANDLVKCESNYGAWAVEPESRFRPALNRMLRSLKTYLS